MKHNARPRHFSVAETHDRREAASITSDDLYARVAALAFSFYERRGREHGYDVEDWIEAEKAILEETAPQNGNPVPKARKSASPKT